MGGPRGQTWLPLPLLVAAALLLAPSSASAATLCVGTSGGSCTTAESSLTAAMAAAVSGDTIRIGPGSYTASNPPDGAVTTQPHVTLIGAGPGGPSGTTISGISSSDVELSLTGTGSSASNLEVLIPSGSSGASGVGVNGTVTNVAVVAASGSTNPQGVVMPAAGASFSGSVDLSAGGGTSKFGVELDDGAATVSNSTISGAQTGIQVGPGNGATVTIESTRISDANEDVAMSDGGTVNIVSSLLELGASCNGGCVGVYVASANGQHGEVDLAKIDQDTIVAGTTSGGVAAGWAVSVNGQGASESATAEIDSSVGVGFPAAGGTDPGGNVECFEGTSGAGAVSIGYSSFNFTGMTGSSGSITQDCPSPTLTSNQNQGAASPVLPVFVNAATGDYHLPYNSPLVDAGDPSLTGGTDLDGNPRVVNGKTDIGAYEYQRGAPTASASGPGSATPGQALTFNGSASSDPNEGESISSYSWSFDDGTSATGAVVTHAYAAAGTHHATLTVKEPNGLSASTTVTTTVASPTPVISAPVISAVSFVKAHTSGKGKHRHRHASEITLQISKSATVTVTLERLLPGREKAGTCLAATRARRHLPKCTLSVSAGTVTEALPAGTGAVPLPKQLHPGNYEATIVALASSGPASTPVTTTFHVG